MHMHNDPACQTLRHRLIKHLAVQREQPQLEQEGVPLVDGLRSSGLDSGFATRAEIDIHALGFPDDDNPNPFDMSQEWTPNSIQQRDDSARLGELRDLLHYPRVSTRPWI